MDCLDHKNLDRDVPYFETVVRYVEEHVKNASLFEEPMELFACQSAEDKRYKPPGIFSCFFCLVQYHYL